MYLTDKELVNININSLWINKMRKDRKETLANSVSKRIYKEIRVTDKRIEIYFTARC